MQEAIGRRIAVCNQCYSKMCKTSSKKYLKQKGLEA
jgi:hypothetical protein